MGNLILRNGQAAQEMCHFEKKFKAFHQQYWFFLDEGAEKHPESLHKDVKYLFFYYTYLSLSLSRYDILSIYLPIYLDKISYLAR